jgi:hypothetical protein
MAVRSDKAVEVGNYLGRYIRVGRSARNGPTFLLRRYDGARRLWTTVNIFTNTESHYAHSDLIAGVVDGLIHVVGKRRDS